MKVDEAIIANAAFIKQMVADPGIFMNADLEDADDEDGLDIEHRDEQEIDRQPGEPHTPSSYSDISAEVDIDNF